MQTIQLHRLPCPQGGRILDLGCGEGRHSIGAHWERPDLDIIGVDLNAQDLRTAQQKAHDFFGGSHMSDRSASSGSLNWSQSDGLRLPFADHSFDAVICSEVLEHIPNDHGMLIEIRRVLKPDGHLAISVPRYWPEALCWALSDAYHNVKGGHVRIFKRSHLQKTVEILGYTLVDRHWAHALHSPFWWLKCALWNRPNHWAIRAYHKLLVWDLMQRPWLTRTLERLLNPLFGKSIVLYFAPDALSDANTPNPRNNTPADLRPPS